MPDPELPPTPFSVIDETEGLNDELASTARELLETWDRWKYTVTPSPAAAAAYYAAQYVDHERKYSQNDVADLFDVSNISVRTYWREILEANSFSPPSDARGRPVED